MTVEQLEIVAVVAVLLIVAASYLAPKFGIATPIALVVTGLGLSLLPGMPAIAPSRTDPRRGAAAAAVLGARSHAHR